MKSPFRRLTKKRCNEALREQYDDPFFLRYDEVLQIMTADVPDSLKETKDAFLLQCALGCRIGDYLKLSMSNIAITDDGIPYVQYLPKKTMKKQNDRREKKTPLMLFALEMVKRSGFKFGVLKYTSGKSGYNAKIKKLLEHCKIDRLLNQYDEATVRCTVYHYTLSVVANYVERHILTYPTRLRSICMMRCLQSASI